MTLATVVCPVCDGGNTRLYQALAGIQIWQCRSCRGRFVFPVPAPFDLRVRYQAEHSSGKWQGRFSEHCSEAEMTRRAVLITELATGRGRVLDLGCGDGRFLDAARREGWTAIGTEIAQSAASLVAARHPVLVGEIPAIRDGPLFDAITFWDVLEHLGDPRAALKEARRRLKRGGIIAISMPNLRGTASLTMGRKWPYYNFQIYGHLYHLALPNLQGFLREAGLCPIYRETRGSVDLRDLPGLHTSRHLSEAFRWCLDKLSGALALVAEPLGYGNTQIVVGRLDAAPTVRSS